MAIEPGHDCPHLREVRLDLILEGKVKRLGGEVPDDIRQISAPEGRQALLLVHPLETVRDARVAGNFAGLDARIRILGLHYELHALDGRRACLGDRAAHAPKGEVHQKARVLLVLAHLLGTIEVVLLAVVVVATDW